MLSMTLKTDRKLLYELPYNKDILRTFCSTVN